MANMSYCRFQNTYHDLLDCTNQLGQVLDDELTLNDLMSDLSKDEQYYYMRLVNIARDLVSYHDELKDRETI